MNYRSLDKSPIPDENPGNFDTNHLLVIGIDDYKNGVSPLHNAVNDASAFKNVLLNKYYFHEQNTHILFNEDATRSNIISAFKKLLRQVGENDNLVFYFSGHGIFNKDIKQGFWIPVDGVKEDEATYISNSDVLNYIKAIKAKHIFGVVDSCFSSALFLQRGEESQGQNRIYQQASRWLLTAGRLEMVEDGSLGDNSPFTESLVSQLKLNNAALWVGDLCRYVVTGTMANAAKQIPRGEPLQNAGHQGGEFIFFPKEISKVEVEAIIKPAPSSSSVTRTPKSVEDETEKKVINLAVGRMKFRFDLSDFALFKVQLKSEAPKDLDTGIQLLNKLLDPFAKTQNELIILASRYNSLKASNRRGILSSDQKTIQENRITMSLLDFIEYLEIADFNSEIRGYFE